MILSSVVSVWNIRTVTLIKIPLQTRLFDPQTDTNTDFLYSDLNGRNNINSKWLKVLIIQQNKDHFVMICQKVTKTFSLCLISDFLVVVASIVVLSVGSNGQVFATSAIRWVFSLLVSQVWYQ